MLMARLASEHEAAESVGIDVATFRAWVDCGRLPKPLPDCNKFDLKAIDAALDRVSGIGTPANALETWRQKRRAG
jgi:predicted site-specific integrase-resolvase